MKFRCKSFKHFVKNLFLIGVQEAGEIIPFPVLILPFPVFKAILDLLVKVSGWMEQMGIRLTSASSGVGVEVGAELGNIL